ncbi:hypothetical protein MN116_007795 [Schistosoma mekongi]|uniref:Uncharacterized protein n=1 Tax=Schistosoma mekongi TaxID=38744 RepID=A0AAE1Z891_SCHME|nr:hypothetical protein MN116_007795 [Schistosoma mekongi]
MRLNTNDIEQLNSSKCQDILSIHKAVLHDRFEHIKDSSNLSIKSNNKEVRSIPSDVCTLSSSTVENLQNDITNIDYKENINEENVMQTTYSKDFPNKQPSTLIALRPRSTRHAFAAPTYRSISTPNSFRTATNLGILSTVDGPHQSTYSTDYIGCWTPQPDSPIRTATSSGTRANKPHPKKDFLTCRNEENQLLQLDQPSSPTPAVRESLTQRDKKLSPHRHSEADLIQSLVYNRPKFIQQLTGEQYAFLNEMRLKSTYQKDFNIVNQYRQQRNLDHDSIKSVHETHPLSITHLHFSKPSWKVKNKADFISTNEEFINGILRLTVPCTRYGSNKNHQRITRGINYYVTFSEICPDTYAHVLLDSTFLLMCPMKYIQQHRKFKMPIKSIINNSLTDDEDYHDGCLSSNLIMLRSRGENIQFITKLNLWGLKLKNVSMLKCMPNLKIINMSSNCLQSLESFTTCLNLCELYLRNNHIVNINEVGHLKYLNKLEKLWLNGNLCCDYFKNYDKNNTIQCNNASIRYRCTVIRNLQRLIHLDQEDITSEERELSEEYGVFLIAPPPQQTIGEQSQSEISDSTVTNTYQNNTEESTNIQSITDITLSSDVEMKRQEHHSHLSVTKNDSQANNANSFNEVISLNGVKEVTNNNNVNIKSLCIKRKCHNRSYLQDVTLKETNKIRQEYGLKPINKNKISSPAKRFQPVDRKNEKIVRNSIIRLLKTLNYDSLERIIQAAEKRLLRLTGLTNSLKLQSLLVNEDNDNEWTPNGTYDCSNYMNDNK